MSKNNELLWITNVRISEGQYPIHGLYREKSYNSEDSGWRVISEIDTEEYLSNESNAVTLSQQEMFQLEPALKKIVDLPVGTELQMIQDETSVKFVDYNTKEPVEV